MNSTQMLQILSIALPQVVKADTLSENLPKENRKIIYYLNRAK